MVYTVNINISRIYCVLLPIALVCLTVCRTNAGQVFRSVHEQNQMISVNFTAIPTSEYPRIPFTIDIHQGSSSDSWSCFHPSSITIPQVVVEGTCNKSAVIVSFPATVEIVLELHIDRENCDTVVIGPQSKYIYVFVGCTISANVCIK